MASALRTASASLFRARAAPIAARAVAAPRIARVAVPVRFYASGSGLSSSDIQSRITEVLKSFEKVDPSKVSASYVLWGRKVVGHRS